MLKVIKNNFKKTRRRLWNNGLDLKNFILYKFFFGLFIIVSFTVKITNFFCICFIRPTNLFITDDYFIDVTQP